MGTTDAPPAGKKWHVNPNGSKVAVPSDVIIDDYVVIGEGVVIGKDVIIQRNACIGDGCVIGADALIGGFVIVPDGTNVAANKWVSRDSSGELVFTTMRRTGRR